MNYIANSLRQKNVCQISLSLSGLVFEEAVFIEPNGCCIRGLRKGNVKQGHNLVIIGCDISGLVQVQIAKKYKVRQIIVVERRPFRRKPALFYGADLVVNHADELTWP